MTYSTGSGTYTALMAAVLAHAVTDGWTTSAGNWPISKGNVRGVDWSTRTLAATDYLSGAGLPITERIIDIAVGTSLANATANAASTLTSAAVRGMQYGITDWHIFSDPASGIDYIHVVCRFSNGYDADCYAHFSFGELNKGGMTYGSVAYAAASNRRPYVAIIPSGSTNTNQSYDWNCGVNCNWRMHFGGYLGAPSNYDRQTGNNIVFIVNGTTNPLPGSGGWPLGNTVATQDVLLDTSSPNDVTLADVSVGPGNSSQYNFAMNFLATVCQAQPFSGGITLSGLPFIVLNNGTSTALAIMLGTFPGVRICSLKSFAAKEEVTFGADTWKLMPLLKKTDFSQMQQSSIVSSGETGFAYKKVP